MNRSLASCLVLILAATAGCKGESGSLSAASTSSQPSAPQGVNQSPGHDSPLPSQAPPFAGCSVAGVENGAKITCGDTSTIVNDGRPAPALPPPPKVPVLIDGRSSNPDGPEVQVGTQLISITKNASTELITVWIEKVDAVLQYENGIVSPRNTAVYFNSSDCSGDGVYQTNPDPHSFSFGMGDRIVYWDRYYRLNGVAMHCYPRSKRERDGSCTTITGPMTGDFNGFVATPADPGVTTVLSSGYRVKMK